MPFFKKSEKFSVKNLYIRKILRTFVVGFSNDKVKALPLLRQKTLRVFFTANIGNAFCTNNSFV